MAAEGDHLRIQKYLFNFTDEAICRGDINIKLSEIMMVIYEQSSSGIINYLKNTFGITVFDRKYIEGNNGVFVHIDILVEVLRTRYNLICKSNCVIKCNICDEVPGEFINCDRYAGHIICRKCYTRLDTIKRCPLCRTYYKKDLFAILKKYKTLNTIDQLYIKGTIPSYISSLIEWLPGQCAQKNMSLMLHVKIKNLTIDIIISGSDTTAQLYTGIYEGLNILLYYKMPDHLNAVLEDTDISYDQSIKDVISDFLERV